MRLDFRRFTTLVNFLAKLYRVSTKAHNDVSLLMQYVAGNNSGYKAFIEFQDSQLQKIIKTYHYLLEPYSLLLR